MYRNDYGYWIAMGKQLSLAARPNRGKPRDDTGGRVETLYKTDFTDNGWYTPESVRNLDRYQRPPFATTAVARRIAGQTMYSEGSGMQPVSGSTVFPDVARLNDLWPSLNPLAWIWSWLQRWGSLVSTATRACALVWAMNWCFWFGMRMMVPKSPDVSWFAQTLGALMPSMRDLQGRPTTRP